MLGEWAASCVFGMGLGPRPGPSHEGDLTPLQSADGESDTNKGKPRRPDDLIVEIPTGNGLLQYIHFLIPPFIIFCVYR